MIRSKKALASQRSYNWSFLSIVSCILEIVVSIHTTNYKIRTVARGLKH